MNEQPNRPTGRAPRPGEGLIIDLFAGGGGASEAILRATGRHPDVAVNHDREAIALHTANHPHTLHYCDDIRKVEPAEVMTHFPGRTVDLLWASPDCKDHSKAKGGKPKDKNIRGLAWEVLRWAAGLRRASGKLPRIIALENVEEFQDWGPIHKYGKRANHVVKGRRGELFKLWVSQLESLGFKVEWRELVAADYGAPTTRKRLFLIARSDGQAIRWPQPTHAKVAKQGDLLEPPKAAWKAAADIINWNLPIPSIFGRKKALMPKTRARIAKGIKRYVIAHHKPFIVPLTHSGERRGIPLDEPHPTITSANRGETALVAPFLKPRYGERDGQDPRARSVEDPHPTVVPTGNGADLAAVVMQKMSENGQGYLPSEVLHTAMAGAPRHYTVAAYLGRQFGTTESGRDIADPHPTVMTDGGGGKSQVIAAHLQRDFGRSVGSDLEQPAGAITAGGGGKAAVVAAYMAQHNGDRLGRPADEPVTTLVHRATQQQLAVASLVKYYGTASAEDVHEPLDTVTSKGRFGLSAAYIEQANTGMVGRSAEEPLATIVAGGDKSGWGTTQRLVEAQLEAIGAPAGSKRREVLSFLWEHFGEPTEAEWADPLATLEGRVKFGLVVIGDICWQIVDIGMRMLTPRELYAAQGFGPDYVIELTFAGKPLTKTAQTRMAGNSVSPPPAAALLNDNLPAHMLLEQAA